LVRHRLTDDEWDLISDLFPESQQALVVLSNAPHEVKNMLSSKGGSPDDIRLTAKLLFGFSASLSIQSQELAVRQATVEPTNSRWAL